MLETLHGAVLIVILAAAAWSDVRTSRIPNALTVPAAAAGLVLSAAGGELTASALALAAAFALGFVLFVTGVLGGGDVKLLIAAGALLGIGRLPMALLLTALAGGALALAVAARRRVLLPVLFSSKDTLASWVTPGAARAPRPAMSGIGVPYGVAIAAGAIGAWFL